MPKLNNTIISKGYFEIDDEPRNKGNYEADYTTPEAVGIYSVLDANRRFYIVPADTHYSKWTNNDNVPYASYQDLISDLRDSFHDPSSISALSQSNSSNIAIAASSNYVGEWEDVSVYDSVIVAAKTDQDGSRGGSDPAMYISCP